MPATIETGGVVETVPVSSPGTPSINIRSAEPPPPSAPAAPPPKPPQRAKERLFAGLDKAAGVEPSPPPPDRVSAIGNTDKGAAPEGDQTAATSPEETPTPDAGEKPAETEAPPPGTKGKQASPWKLVETYKTKAKALEAEVADLKSRIAPESDFKAVQERLTKAEAALAEREEFVRLHNYQQSQEYQDKYQKPYEAAWQKAAKTLSEISITDPGTGQERVATVNDMELLVNAPLGQARKLATEIFGDFANDAMAMRERILGLYDAQQEAIQTAKKTGADREKAQTLERQQATEKLKQEVANIWAKANEEVLADPKYGSFFKPREGDDEWNGWLAKATAYVDKAFATLRPTLPEGADKAEIIKMHAKIRQGAIAFGPLRRENARLKAERDDWKAKFEAISKSTPPAGQGAQRGVKPAEPAKAKDRLFGALDKIAVGGGG